MSFFLSSASTSSLPCCSSTFSSSVPSWKFDVFISFRGEDTRKTFTSYLHSALRRENIETYIDEEDLGRGDEISPALVKAIEESMISVVVFSENYANSSWCLDELVHILKCKREYGRQVVPVFYKVDPSHVRKQQGSYAIGFEQLQKHSKEKVNSWGAALTEAANLAGWSLQDTRTESKLVEVIVEDILKKLNGMSPSCDHEYLKGLFGIEKHIESLSDIGTQEDVRILGIWGMGGIGKTTLARVLFNKFSHLFDGRCFLENVREESEKANGFRELKFKLFSELLNRKDLNPDSTFERNRLRRKNVFVVLDDVSSVRQLNVLAGDRDWFGSGSRIIITTRDKRTLIHQVDEIYELIGLNHDEALQLFHLHAFKNGSPTSDFKELSKQAVAYAGGNPLALTIFGSFLSGRKIEDWESAFKRLKNSTLEDSDIHKILKISYDRLRKDEKDAFLDIACLFKGKYKNFVERMLDDDSSPGTVIDDLADKCLITIGRNKIIHMHDLVQDIGQEIVRHQSTKEPGNRSRIWDAKDAYHVLKNNTGTVEVEAIFLNENEIRETQLNLPQDVFNKMYNLRILKIQHSMTGKVYLPQGLESLPDKLKYLKWTDYPLKSLPGNFSPCNLVVLEMPESKVEKLWDGVPDLQNLREINLFGSEKLTHLPYLSRASNIETVFLDGCTSLVEVPSYFQHLDKLTSLHLRDCKSLKKFPQLPPSVKYLDASDCISLEEVSTGIQQNSFYHNDDLEFNFGNCWELEANNIMTFAHYRMLWFVQNLLMDDDDNEALRLWWAGDEIPRWFSYQSEVPSLSIELSLDCFVDLLGIAFCAVVHSINFGNHGLFCEVHSDSSDGVLLTWDYCWFVRRELQGDHVFVFSNKNISGDFINKVKEYISNRNNGCPSISIHFNFYCRCFDFSAAQDFELEVERCGVQFLYEKDAEKLLGTPIW